MSDDPRDLDWLGHEWQRWVDLDAAVAGRGGIPRVQGIYRVRCRGTRGLLYIGISGSLSARLRRLRRGMSDPHGVGHYAGGCVASHAAGRVVEVSWVELPLPKTDRRELMGIEVDLIAAYRAFTGGKSPPCQFAGGRLPA